MKGTRRGKRANSSRQRSGYSKQFKVLARALAAAALVCGLLVWLLLRNVMQPETSPKVMRPAVAHSAQRRPERPAKATLVQQARSKPVPSAELMDPGSHDSSEDGPRHPHPIGPKRRHIYRENNLIGVMNRAMDLGRFQELRELNYEYRRDYPEDEHVLQDAYEIIADCQEELTDERRERARAFWKKRRSSQLRRHVRKHCQLDVL